MSTSDLFSRCINREEDPQYSREYWVAMRAWYADRALTAWSDYHPWREAVRCPLPVPEGEVWQARLGRGVGVVDLQEGPGLVMCGHGRIWLARERGLSVFPVRVVLGRLPPSSHMFRAISVEEKADRSVLVLQRIGMFFVFCRRCLVCFARFVFLAARLSRKTASSYLFV
jgi:hypothetical protein